MHVNIFVHVKVECKHMLNGRILVVRITPYYRPILAHFQLQPSTQYQINVQ